MVTPSPFARSLLALACFALLVAACTAHNFLRPVNRRSNNQGNCEEYLSGRGSNDPVILDQIETKAYQKVNNINNVDKCFKSNKRLVGSMIVACDPLGPPAPSVLSLSTLSQVVSCHTDGPCSAGLTVAVTQYCAKG